MEPGIKGLGELSLSVGGDALTSIFLLDEEMATSSSSGDITCGLRFCTKGSGCTIEAHEKKIPLKGNSLYIIDPESLAYRIFMMEPLACSILLRT